KKIYDTAAKGRADWATGPGANKALLDLVQTLDSAVFFHSRKLYAGCEGKTAAALATAVSKLPAKTFKAMHDVRDAPERGFASKAGPVLVNNAEVNLAAIAYAECQPKTGIGDFLASYLQEVPGQRG